MPCCFLFCLTFLLCQGDLSEVLPDVLCVSAARDGADAVVQRPADHHGERSDAVLGGDLEIKRGNFRESCKAVARNIL